MTRITTIAIACVLLVVPAYADLTINSPGVVGTVEAGTQDADVDGVRQWANYLLGMGASEEELDVDANVPPDGETENYRTSSTDYNATLTGGTRVDGGETNVSGFQWVMAKYDGQNAGYVLFYVPDLGTTTIPADSKSIWTNIAGEGYGLSNFTGFGSTSVPDGGMTLMLLGGGLVGLETLRRRFRG